MSYNNIELNSYINAILQLAEINEYEFCHLDVSHITEVFNRVLTEINSGNLSKVSQNHQKIIQNKIEVIKNRITKMSNIEPQNRDRILEHIDGILAIFQKRYFFAFEILPGMDLASILSFAITSRGNFNLVQRHLLAKKIPKDEVEEAIGFNGLRELAEYFSQCGWSFDWENIFKNACLGRQYEFLENFELIIDFSCLTIKFQKNDSWSSKIAWKNSLKYVGMTSDIKYITHWIERFGNYIGGYLHYYALTGALESDNCDEKFIKQYTEMHRLQTLVWYSPYDMKDALLMFQSGIRNHQFLALKLILAVIHITPHFFQCIPHPFDAEDIGGDEIAAMGLISLFETIPVLNEQSKSTNFSLVLLKYFNLNPLKYLHNKYRLDFSKVLFFSSPDPKLVKVAKENRLLVEKAVKQNRLDVIRFILELKDSNITRDLSELVVKEFFISETWSPEFAREFYNNLVSLIAEFQPTQAELLKTKAKAYFDK